MKPDQLKPWFDNVRRVLETAYLAHPEPWRQSGMSGPEQRWISLRKPVAACIDQSGTFLDIGCANGYLLECCLKWTAERNLQLDPYGLDLSARLIALAQQRLPQFADHFFVGNAFYWLPPIKFDFVRTELVYVPGEHERQYIEVILERYLRPGGKLLIAHYGEGSVQPEKGLLPGSQPTKHILERLTELGFEAMSYQDGYDPMKHRTTRVAILTNQVKP
jgi:SAM-dependent methyltransferase